MVNIRLATSRDLILIQELETRELNENLNEVYYQFIDTEKLNIFVAFDSDSLVGVLSIFNILGEVEVLNFCVKKEYQSKGIGQTLFNQMIHFLKPLKIRLEVRETNARAIQFYTLMGFNKIGIRKNYYGGCENALLMGKDYYEDISN